MAALTGERWTRAAALDVSERLILSLLFLRLAYVNYVPVIVQHQAFNALVVISEFLCVGLLLVRRRSNDFSTRPMDWLFAFLGTAAPLLARPGGGAALAPAWVGLVLLLGGTIIQLSAKLMLRRSYGLVAANRGVKVEGPYRLVRHPMYLGYVTVHIGFLLMRPNLWNLCIYAFALTNQIFRILAEERLLMADPTYVAFARRVRYRLLPGVF